MRINKTYMAKALAATFLTVGFTACATEELADLLGSTADGGRLSVVPEMLGSEASHASTATRATTENGVDALSENNLGETLDVFIAGGGTDGTGSYWNQYHLTKAAGASIQESVADVLSYNCLGEAPALVLGDKYRVYVAVNNAQTNATIADEAALKTLSVTDADICRHEGPEADTGKGTQTAKRFMMDYYQADWSPLAGNAVHQIQAQLSRAAVKFRVKIKFDTEFYKQLTETDGYRINSPAWRLFNYNTSAPVFAGGDAVVPTLATAPRFSLDKTGNDEYELVTYSYPFSWTKATADDVAPSILFSFDLVENGKSSKGEYHYYRIPLTNLTALQRNHLYEVTATINSYGSSSEMVQTTDVDLQYKVVDWTDEASSIEANKAYYLIVSPEFSSIYGTGARTQLLDVVAPESVWEQKDGENGLKIEAFKSYYYDKSGKKTNITTATPTIDYSEKKIKVISNAPGNHAVQYISFVVYYTVNGVKYSQKVYLKHFPLDYIENIAGWWSSRDEAKWVRWGDSNKNRTQVLQKNQRGSDFFYAKVAEGENIYKIKDYNTQGDKSTQSNYHMYTIQITSTSNEYVIGKPVFNDKLLSADKVVSPAFMIASQLGLNANGCDHDVAKKHCNVYIEVAQNDDKLFPGKEFKGWRLPTQEEIKIIMKYQNGAAMDELLPRIKDGYWCADGYYLQYSSKKYTANNGYEKNGNVINTAKYIRCVRDLTPEEVETINSRKE